MVIYKRLVQLLKKEHSPNLPVKVRRVSVPFNNDGDCQKKDGYFLIRIERTLEEHEAIETLLHEWAHLLVWDHTQKHTNEWGVAYSKMYRFFINNSE